MVTAQLLLVLLLFFISTAGSRGATEEADADDIPIVGRPSDLPFSGASGWFEARTNAAPTTLEAETPLTFTLTVRALRPTRRPPQRLNLRQLPTFETQFFIEDGDEKPGRPDKNIWEFTYRLKPRRSDVREIPDLPFVYFNPYLRTSRKGFQVIYTDPISLHVLPHKTYQVPVQAPENAFALATGSAVLERRTAWTPPSIGTIELLVLTPPLLCFIWYLCWMFLYPDAARRARQRRSRAARRALRMLRTTRRLDAESRAARTAAIVAGYLQERLDSTIAEPTPSEAAALLRRFAASLPLTEQAVHLFETCDRLRFQPAAANESVDLIADAAHLILAVEEQSCSAPRC